MSPHLIYVVGPSGAGKDSLLNWLRGHLPSTDRIHWARRTIDRPPSTEGEVHESVSSEGFKQLLDTQQLAMHWSANALQYGIRHSELSPHPQDSWIFVNGSRAHIPVAAMNFPELTVLHITAQPEVLHQRLLARGRESLEAIEQRLSRTPPLKVPATCQFLEFLNHEPLETSGPKLQNALTALPGWPLA
jgi:ribose 1,5-bisphosphokinase